MAQTISLYEIFLLTGFTVLVAMAAWHRTQLDAEIEVLPEAERDRFGWRDAAGLTVKRVMQSHDRSQRVPLLLRLGASGDLQGWMNLT